MKKKKKREIVLFKDESEVFRKELENVGFDVVRFVPVLKFGYVNERTIVEEMRKSEYVGAIFTSPRAARGMDLALASIDDRDRERIETSWKSKPIFVVGSKTMEETKRVWTNRIGKNPNLRGQRSGSAQKLCDIEILPFLKEQSPGSKLLFLCGQNRRPTILSMCGGTERVRECVVYKSIPTSTGLNELAKEKSFGDEEKIRWYVFFSPRGVSIVRRHRAMCVNKIRGAYLASIGSTTKKAIESSGWTCAATPSNPGAASLARAIRNKIIYFKRQQFRRNALGYPLLIIILPMLAWIVYKLGSKI
jgi:uroporphyrinogen-III synthase